MALKVFQRVLLFFMPQKHQPDYPYLRHVRISRVHLFTLIQLLSLVGMFAVKNIKSIAIIFPLLVSREKRLISATKIDSLSGRRDKFCAKTYGENLLRGRTLLVR